MLAPHEILELHLSVSQTDRLVRKRVKIYVIIKMITQNCNYLDHLLQRKKKAAKEIVKTLIIKNTKKEAENEVSSSNTDRVILLEPSIIVPRGNFYYPLSDNYKVYIYRISWMIIKEMFILDE